MNLARPLEHVAWRLGRRPGGWTMSDAVLAVLLLLVMVTEILPNSEMTPRVPLTGLSLGLTLPLAWRQTCAGPVAVVVALSHLAMSIVATGPFAPQLSILPLLVGLYSAGLGTRSSSSLGYGLVTLVLTVASWAVTEEGDLGDFWPWMLWAGAWATGTFVRRRTDLAAEHAGRAAALEVEARSAAAQSAQHERDRIARELHDVVAHAVSVMVVQAGAERLRLGEASGRTGDVLEAIEESGRSALAELRTMLGVLRDHAQETLTPLPGLAAVPTLVERVRDAGLPVSLTCRPPELLNREQRGDGPDGAGLAAYRIVQEALTNVVRHAGSAPTRVVVDRGRGVLAVEIRNTLPATPPTAGNGGGRGIAGMRERVAALRGTFECGPVPGGGFAVSAVLPVDDEGRGER